MVAVGGDISTTSWYSICYLLSLGNFETAPFVVLLMLVRLLLQVIVKA